MKILIDESLDIKLKSYLSEFDVYTVKDLDWQGIKNGRLLTLANDNGFNIFLTADRNIVHQQNLNKYNLTILAFKAPSNDIEDHIKLIPNLLKLLHSLTGKQDQNLQKYIEII